MQLVEFIFEFETAEFNELNSFSLGNIIIKGSLGTLSSKSYLGKDASMMLLLSMVELLDGIRSLLRDKQKTTYNFVGVDSSFQFFVKKDERYILIEDVNGILICQCTLTEFLEVFWRDINVFLEKSIKKLNKDELIYGDLVSARRQFIDEFHL